MENKEIFEYLGVDPEKVKTIDDFKKAFDSSFIRQSAITEDHEVVKPILGRYFGTQENEIKKIAKKYSVDINEDEFQKLGKVSDKFDYLVKKHQDLHTGKIKELEEQVGKGNDEKVKEWEAKFTKLQQKHQETEGLLKQVGSEYEGYKQESANKIKGIKLSTILQNEYANIKYRADITDIEREGFNSIISKKYKFDIDENDKPYVMDAEGKRIPSAKQAGAFKTPAEVLAEEAAANKVVQVNQDGGKKVPQSFQVQQQQQQQQQQNGVPVRQVAPRINA